MSACAKNMNNGGDERGKSEGELVRMERFYIAGSIVLIIPECIHF